MTDKEISEIKAYTIQKINSYPKEYGLTVDNYFHLLFPDMLKSYGLRNSLSTKIAEVAAR